MRVCTGVCVCVYVRAFVYVHYVYLCDCESVKNRIALTHNELEMLNQLFFKCYRQLPMLTFEWVVGTMEKSSNLFEI
jgi:hypothetical protein